MANWFPLFSSAVKNGSILGGFDGNAFPYMNFLKGAGSLSSGTTAWPGNLSADGYPVTAPSSNIGGNFNVPPSYFGHYWYQHSGTGNFFFAGSTIIYSGGTFCGLGTNTGTIQFNTNVQGLNPQVEFAFGTQISAVANNGSGFVRLTTTAQNYGSFGSTQAFLVQGLPTNTGANGSNVGTIVDTTHIDLLSVPFTNSGTGLTGEAIAQTSQVSFDFTAGGTYSSMSNAIFCRIADINGSNAFGLQAGFQINADLISVNQAIKPTYARLLNMSQVNGSTASNYTYRSLPSHFSYVADVWVPSYWVGPVTNTGSDVYTCSNPSASGTGAYADGEQVQGQISGANTGINPTLNVNSRGAAPIFDGGCCLQNFILGGTITNGDVLSITFTGTYLSGGAFTLNYTVNTAVDTNLDHLGANIRTAVNANTTLQAANISFNNNGAGYCQIIYNKNAGSGTTFSFSSVSHTTTCQFGHLVAGYIANNTLLTFVYSKIAGGWLIGNLDTGQIDTSSGSQINQNASSKGVLYGVPTEVACEIANRANVNLWLNFPGFYDLTSVANFTATIRDTLNPGLNANIELWNEDWNFSFSQTVISNNLGACLGFLFQSNRQVYGFYALRVRQAMAQVATTWTATRARSQLKCVMGVQLAAVDGTTGSNATYRFQGSDLTTTNTYYSALGGPGGTAGTNYNVSLASSGNGWPLEFCDTVSPATYWAGTAMGQRASDWQGAQSTFTSLLQASANYAAGGSTNITNALNALDTDLRAGLLSQVESNVSAWEPVIAQYDSTRASLGLSHLAAHYYEGGLQAALGNSFSGTIDTGNDATGYAPLSTQLTSNVTNSGWNTSAYGATNDIIAFNMVSLFLAYKTGPYLQALVTDQFNQVVTAHAGRPALPAWFQTDGPSLWALYLTDIYGAYFTSKTAIVAFNN